MNTLLDNLFTQQDNFMDIRLSLDNLQANCYGLFYNEYINTYECIVKDSEETFTTVVVGQLFGFSTDVRFHSEYNDMLIIKFPDEKSLKDMLQNPIEFNDWYYEKLLQQTNA
jgi:hypothetical protein